MPISSPPETSGTTSDDAGLAQRVDGRRLELEPVDLDHAAGRLQVREQRVVGGDLHGRADRQAAAATGGLAVDDGSLGPQARRRLCG